MQYRAQLASPPSDPTKKYQNKLELVLWSNISRSRPILFSFIDNLANFCSVTFHFLVYHSLEYHCPTCTNTNFSYVIYWLQIKGCRINEKWFRWKNMSGMEILGWSVHSFCWFDYSVSDLKLNCCWLSSYFKPSWSLQKTPEIYL